MQTTQELKKRIRASTNQVFTHLSDWVLFFFWLIETARPPLLSMTDAINLLTEADPRLGFIDKESLLHGIQRVRKEGWISNEFQITKRGSDRLAEILPSYRAQRAWDRKWYLLVFDIPEEEKFRRELLRRKIKRLGFGMLQASIWISAYDQRPEVRAISLRYNLDAYIMQAVIQELEGEPVKDIATRVWNIEELSNRYQAFISLYNETGRRLIASHVFFDYMGILKNDPQLPFEMLMTDWKGREANRVFKKLFTAARKRLLARLGRQK